MIQIITDSMSDITQQEAVELGIRVVPLTVRFGEEEYVDGFDMTLDTFYQRLTTVKELPKTSQVTPEAFRKAFKKALENDDDEVLCITGSSILSGTWQSANMAREMLEEKGKRIHIVDSRTAAIGEALLVHEAAAHREGVQNAAQLADLVEVIKRRSMLTGFADQLKYLVMGGRLNGAAGAVGTLLNIKPLLRLEDGSLNQTGTCRGTGKARQWLSEQLTATPPDPRKPLYIGHAYAPDSAELLKQLIIASGVEVGEIRTRDIGSVIGTHTGPGLLAIAWQKKA